MFAHAIEVEIRDVVAPYNWCHKKPDSESSLSFVVISQMCAITRYPYSKA